MTTQSMPGRLLALLLAILLAVPATAWADDSAAAAEYYNQATAAYQQGDYRKAADLLDLAFGADPDLVYKYNRILALQALGDYQTALAELNTMYGPMKADGQNRFDDIDQIRSQLEAAVKSQEEANPDPDPDPDPGIGATAPPPKKDGPNIAGIALVAGGGALLTTGVLFATAIFLPGEVKECLGIQNDVDCDPYRDELIEDFGERPSTDQAREEAESVRNTHGIVAISLLSAGAVVGAVGVVLLLLDGGGGDDEAAATAAGLDSLRVSPFVSGDGAGAALQLRF